MMAKSKLAVAFLDCITCALGAVLLILFTTVTESREVAAELRDAQTERDAFAREHDANQQALNHARNDNRQLADDLAAAHARVGELENDVATRAHERDEARGRVADVIRQNEHLAAERDALAGAHRSQTRELIGLNGDCKRVIFLFDTSGSMQCESFPEYRALLSLWIQRLDFEKFNVISFSDAPTLWTPGGCAHASPATRGSATQHVATLGPEGGTATLAALKEAFALPDVDTVVLFSDGAPTDAEPSEILAQMQNINQRQVPINVVAVGNYFKEDYGMFLRELAQQHGGVFLGR